MSPSISSLVCALPLRACVKRLTAERGATNPLGVVQNIRNLTNLALVSPQISWMLCPTEVPRLKIQQVQSLHVDAGKAV